MLLLRSSRPIFRSFLAQRSCDKKQSRCCSVHLFCSGDFVFTPCISWSAYSVRHISERTTHTLRPISEPFLSKNVLSIQTRSRVFLSVFVHRSLVADYFEHWAKVPRDARWSIFLFLDELQLAQLCAVSHDDLSCARSAMKYVYSALQCDHTTRAILQL